MHCVRAFLLPRSGVQARKQWGQPVKRLPKFSKTFPRKYQMVAALVACWLG